nr:MAG TPA: hypothetical protein [Caudoviricetes sp.]
MITALVQSSLNLSLYLLFILSTSFNISKYI